MSMIGIAAPGVASTSGGPSDEGSLTSGRGSQAAAPTCRAIRQAPFCWQHTAALARLRAHYSGERLERRATALAIYMALTELASQQRTPNRAEAFIGAIADLAGVSETTVRRYLRDFSALGMVAVTRRRVGARLNLANIYHLLAVDTPPGEDHQVVRTPTFADTSPATGDRGSLPVTGDRQVEQPPTTEQEYLSNIREDHLSPAAATRSGEAPRATVPAAGHPPVPDVPSLATRNDRPASRAAGPTSSPYDPLRDELAAFAASFAGELHDQAPLRATLTRLVNLYHRSGLALEAFRQRLYAARQITQERTAAIRARVPVAGERTWTPANKMPYFFAVLEEQLGFRPPWTPPEPAPKCTSNEGPLPLSPVESGAEHSPWCPTLPPSSDHAPDGATAVPSAIPRPLPAAATRAVARAVLETSKPGAGGPPSATAETQDTRLIEQSIVRFTRQFAHAAVADGIGRWAVGLWHESGLDRQAFLTAVREVGEVLPCDKGRPAVADFQGLLAAAVRRRLAST